MLYGVLHTASSDITDLYWSHALAVTENSLFQRLGIHKWTRINVIDASMETGVLTHNRFDQGLALRGTQTKSI
jgi:hypothetical protein